MRGKAFMIWHPSLSYFARDYGLEQIVIGGDGHKEMSAANLRDVIDHAHDSGARVFFYQKDFDGRQVSVLSDIIDAQEVTVNPLSYNWEEEIEATANALVEQ